MRCKRCGKELGENTVHTCVPYQHYKGITGTATMLNGDKFTFIVDDVDLNKNMLILKLTSGKHKGKYSYLFFYEIDCNLKFNLE